jgi:hypothetical protein
MGRGIPKHVLEVTAYLTTRTVLLRPQKQSLKVPERGNFDFSAEDDFNFLF